MRHHKLHQHLNLKHIPINLENENISDVQCFSSCKGLGGITGAAFIAYEAHDLCQSFNELHELQQLASLAETNDDYVFCGYDFNG